MIERGRRLTKRKNEEIKWNDSSPRGIADFLKNHYNIIIPIQDTSKIQITPKDESLWKHQPQDIINEVLLHLKMDGRKVSRSDLLSIILSPNYIEHFDPIKDYFDSIRGIYKGESHIDLLCQFIKPRIFDDNTQEYYEQRAYKLIRKWIVACVACWIGNHPNDVALGLISGRGGIGKTLLGQFLIPQQLKEYYISASREDRLFNLTDAFSRYMFINFEEMEGLNRSTINTFKSLMSHNEVWSKLYHERISSKKYRLACTLFSTNHNQENGGFIHPAFGDTRRFGCIELDDIDYEGYSKQVDVNQIWSEALNLYEDTDFNYKFDKYNDFPDFIQYNQRYLLESSAMHYVQTYLEIPKNENDGEKINSTGILHRLIKDNKIKKEHLGNKEKEVNAMTIGRALASLGFKPAQYRPEGSSIPLNGWHVKFKE